MSRSPPGSLACEEKVCGLVRSLITANDFWEAVLKSPPYLRSLREYAEKIKQRNDSTGPDLYTLRRFYILALNKYGGVYRPFSTEAIFLIIADQIKKKPKLDQLLNADLIIDALKTGKISFEFIFTMNNSEIDHALHVIQNGLTESTTIADEIFNYRNSLLQPIGIDHQNLWKLCIDQRDLQYGPYVYEFRDPEEPGYLCAIECAFMHMIDTLREPLSIDFLKRLWSIATFQVKLNWGFRLEIDDIELNFGRFPASSGDAGDDHPEQRQRVTPEDLKEIFEYGFSELFGYIRDPEKEYPKCVNSTKLSAANQDPTQFFGYAEGRPPKNWELSGDETVERTIREYQKRLSEAITDDEKLYAIARFGKMIDVQHPFGDGNMRTVVLLINKLLIENGFSPTIMPNPNNIDVKHSRWIVDHLIKPGQVFYREQVVAPIASTSSFGRNVSAASSRAAFFQASPIDLEKYPNLDFLVKNNINLSTLSEAQLGQLNEKIAKRDFIDSLIVNKSLTLEEACQLTDLQAELFDNIDIYLYIVSEKLINEQRNIPIKNVLEATDEQLQAALALVKKTSNLSRRDEAELREIFKVSPQAAPAAKS